MVEVKITYETLFDLLRRERSRNEIQDLEDTFYDDVKSYLRDKEIMMNEEDKKFTSRAEKEKIKIQIKNAKKIVKELYETREKKILHLASNKVKTNSVLIKTSNLLPKEKEFFDEAVLLLRKSKKDMLKEIVVLETAEIDSSEMKNTKQEKEIKEEPKKNSDEQIKIKLSSNLPKFVGLDQKIYGPYSKGEIVDLPSNVANLLVNKGRAETI
ncbi:MAG: hypothetical protein ACMXX9_00175 [Candidatus Woesearchaeota archaeon]